MADRIRGEEIESIKYFYVNEVLVMPLKYNFKNNESKVNINQVNTNSVDKNNGISSRKENYKNEQQFKASEPKYQMSDLIISDSIYDEIVTVVRAQECWDKVFNRWNLKSVMKDRQNLMINLYGAPGTGKTMAAHAIAYELRKKIICVNYADIESKYVGETSKNLTSLFNYAVNSRCILFFDEADALLSKRVTNMSNSTDVSVNQTRSVLLTLLNDYKGMVIFATNFISNYDSAFMRRIQYHIKFELPNEELRKMLWRKYIPYEMPNDVDFNLIAKKYDKVSGSDISNAVLKAALKAVKNNESMVPQKYFEEAIISALKSKEANTGTNVIIEKRPVSEEYALSQIKENNQINEVVE